MSAVERPQDAVERVATVTPLPSRATPDPAAAVPVLPSRAAVLDFITPPDIWSDKRPSLRDIWLYARHGRWTHQTGLLRVLGCMDAFGVVLPAHAIGYTILWVVERPSRRFVFAVLATFVYLTFN